MDPLKAEGQQVRVSDNGPFMLLDAVRPTSDGWRLYLIDGAGAPVLRELAREDAHKFEVLYEDGNADAARTLARNHERGREAHGRRISYRGGSGRDCIRLHNIRRGEELSANQSLRRERRISTPPFSRQRSLVQ